jgi:hypothetical protein
VNDLKDKQDTLKDLLEKIGYAKPYEAATLSQQVKRLMVEIREEEYAMLRNPNRKNED